jgi:hypothetical protein
MAENVEMVSVIAPAGSIPFEPAGGDMEFALIPIPSTPTSSPTTDTSLMGDMEYLDQLDRLTPTPATVKKIPEVMSDKVTVIFDTETTGISKFESKLIVCSFWEVGQPKSDMVTFSGFDEEKLIREIVDYLNLVNPGRLVAYNISFDRVFLLSRMMLHGLVCPCMKNAEAFDMMDVLSKGGITYSKAETTVGKAEEWLYYLFGETKPYMIEECMDDAAKGDLTKMIIRNRVCVGSEGDLYALLLNVWGEGLGIEGGESPSIEQLDEAAQLGITRVQCPNCLTANDYNANEGDQYCFLCGTKLDPSKIYQPWITHSTVPLESKYVAGQLPNWQGGPQPKTSSTKKSS